MPPTTLFQVAVYIVGSLITLPVLGLLWKGALFFAKATTKLDQIDTIAEDVRTLREDKQSENFSVELSLSVIEDDINALQKHSGLAPRAYPNRRIGPPDRRAS